MPRRLLILASLFGVVLMASPLSVVAQNLEDADTKLQSVQEKIKSQQAESERQKARADKLKAEMADISKQLIEAAKRVQNQEVDVARLEAELGKLEYFARQKELQLRDRRQQFSGVMMALSRIARFPTEALIAQPIPPEDTVRSAILLRAAVPAIEQRAASLKTELDELSQARREVEVQRHTLQAAAEALREDQMRIEAMRKQKAAMRAEAISKSRAAQSKARNLAKQAKSLQDLVGKLNKAREDAQREAEREAKRETARKDAELQPQSAASAQIAPDLSALGGIGSISKARGKLPFPVVGSLVGRYGQQLDGGLTSKGVSLQTRNGARVISPFDGKVVFAGPFRAYGQLLIIDHGEGYHTLLAGLGRIDTSIGQAVLAGEPVALMSRDAEQPVLYVEFRRDNQPINPLPWLASRKTIPKS